jgi:transglutaminase superfamily protein
MTEGHDPLPGKWRRFRERPPEDRALILRAALILPLTEIGLRLFGFRRWKEWIEKFSLPADFPQSLPADVQREAALRAVRAVRSVELHGPANPNCLERSLTLWWLLRRNGVDGELHIGARKQGTRFEAHAWVELGGQVLNDGAEVHQHYARFDAPIAAAEAGSRVAKEADSHPAGKADSQ